MNEIGSSCEIGGAQGKMSQGSRVLRFQPGFHWEGVPVADYKQAAEHWCGVRRTVLVGETGENTAFHLRYFEIGPGGFSSLEEHTHEHVVVVMRGRGLVRLGQNEYEVSFGDTIYVAPGEVHQLRCSTTDEPFGFLCVVDAQRDRPILRTDLCDSVARHFP